MAASDEQHQCKRLSFIQRLNIATDVAYALEYLHLHCHTLIVHYDVKPSNVLLNEDMVAQVGGFGLAKFVFETSHNLSKNQSMPDCLSGVLKGSAGYIPPSMFSTINLTRNRGQGLPSASPNSFYQLNKCFIFLSGRNSQNC